MYVYTWLFSQPVYNLSHTHTRWRWKQATHLPVLLLAAAVVEAAGSKYCCLPTAATRHSTTRVSTSRLSTSRVSTAGLSTAGLSTARTEPIKKA